METIHIVICIIGVAILCIIAVIPIEKQRKFKKLMFDILNSLNLTNFLYMGDDIQVNMKSSKAVETYDITKFFKESPERLQLAINTMNQKSTYANMWFNFLQNNSFKNNKFYSKAEEFIKENLDRTNDFYVGVIYVSPTGRSSNYKCMVISPTIIQQIASDESFYMTKTEYNRYLKDKEKNLLEQKQNSYYDSINSIIDISNNNRDILVIKENKNKMDALISSLVDKTLQKIKKIKTIDSSEWEIIDNIIKPIEQDIISIVNQNQSILNYYNSQEFNKIKTTCESLMSSQKEFNEYIDAKVKSITNLFGTKIIRNETVIDDDYNYIRPYKKSITPFTVEVSQAVFSSAENNPLEYIIKHFYPNKDLYPQQIQKLQLLIEKLETLKDAKQIIENYKQEYQQYITNVPDYIMQYDKDGFYERLGFANISENTLTVEYKFVYTSNGGRTQKSFTVPMTEETIIQLIDALQNKLTQSSFSKEQRRLMTSKLRQKIKERDNYTCKICGNSTHKEPNLLLEIDHIIPVAKGGLTEEDNLQTLCWKCNRHKSDNIV